MHKKLGITMVVNSNLSTSDILKIHKKLGNVKPCQGVITLVAPSMVQPLSTYTVLILNTKLCHIN